MTRAEIYEQLDKINDKIWKVAYDNKLTEQERRELAKEIWLKVDQIKECL